VTPTILGEHHGIRATETASFEVLVSPPLSDSAGRAVGCYSRLSKIPSGTGAQVEAFVDRSLATAFSTRGMWCRSRTSKSFFQLLNMEQVRNQLRVIAAALILDLLDDKLGITLHKQLSNPKGQSAA
jgi:hypothetical protein